MDRHPTVDRWYVAFVLSGVLLWSAAGCITLEREDPGGGDVAVDAPPNDTGTGDQGTPDEGADTSEPDTPVDTVGPDAGGCPFECTQPSTACRSWQCNPQSGQCEPVNAEDGTDCGGPCTPGVCQQGECLIAPVSGGPGYCTGRGQCQSGPCGTYACNLDSCMCELTDQGDGPGCCVDGGCDHLGGPPGCANAYCEPSSNECIAESWDPSQCQCELPSDCGPPVDACSTWTCDLTVGCLETKLPGCVPCSPGQDDAPCAEAASLLGACWVGTCTASGVCDLAEQPDCEACSTAGDCQKDTVCDVAACNNGACTYASEPDCVPCFTATDCPQPPDCGSYSCSAGQCVHFPVPCNSDCSSDTDCVPPGPCDESTCNLNTGKCETYSPPYCSPQVCNNAGIIAVAEASAAPPGSLVKVTGIPVLGMVTNQQAKTCFGDQDGSVDSGPIAVSGTTGSVQTAWADGPWTCFEDCGALTACTEPHVGVSYWVWGTTTADGGIDVADWCLEMTEPNIFGSYDVILYDDGSGLSVTDTAVISKVNNFLSVTFQGGSVEVTNPELQSSNGELIMQLTSSQFPGTATAVLAGDGNTLVGTVNGNGLPDAQMIMTRLP